MHAPTVKELAHAWLTETTAKANSTIVRGNIFAHEYNHQLLTPTGLSMRSGADAINPFYSPAKGAATDSYAKDANNNVSPGSAPVSIYEGLQTSIDIARRRSGYNPLDQPTDQKPKAAGDREHFIAFTQQIANIPFLSLLAAQVTQIQQKSHDANALVDSFVKGFIGLKNQDVEQIKQSLSSLVNAALSYSEQTERQSNFNQNILQTGNGGSVNFMLYASEFTIKASSHKGTITFQSSYTLSQAIYQLSVESWNNVKDTFSKQQKTDTEQWLDDTTTPVKEGSKLRAICLVG
uniref:PIP-47Bc n=1 Tax=Pseudomonas monteilii TaxID=76759 RepID=A0A286R033_9PSED|nr:PIP-47Bc [Pseudomonas monteilii]